MAQFWPHRTRFASRLPSLVYQCYYSFDLRPGDVLVVSNYASALSILTITRREANHDANLPRRLCESESHENSVSGVSQRSSQQVQLFSQTPSVVDTLSRSVVCLHLTLQLFSCAGPPVSVSESLTGPIFSHPSQPSSLFSLFDRKINPPSIPPEAFLGFDFVLCLCVP